MSIKAVNWALNSVKCTPDLKVILLAMGERADDNGMCHPSQQDLANKTCIPLRSLKRKMAQLKDLDVITVMTKQVSKNLRRNQYRLHLEYSFDLLPVREKDGANLAPLSEEVESEDGATVTPLNSANLAPSSEQWCHSSGTYNGATQVAHKPSSNHQYSNSNNTTADAVSDVFTISDARKRFAMTSSWKPSAHVFEQLEQHGVSPDLAASWLPEFTIYHCETVDRQGAFDAKFLKNCLHRFRTTQSEPKTLPRDWYPAQQTIALLRGSGVDVNFICSAADSFALYWTERGEARHAWEAMFVAHCNSLWAKRQANSITTITDSESLARKLTDRSWAIPHGQGVERETE